MAADLPRLPSGGNRRELDQQWHALLERDGVTAHLHSPPSSPKPLEKAVAEFNSGAFWECHESLEDLWRETPYPLRLFYHGIIKVAVGLHHVGRHNRHGAHAKLADGVRLLILFQPSYMGVRTDELLEDCRGWVGRLDGEGRVDWAEVDAAPRPIIRAVGESQGG